MVIKEEGGEAGNLTQAMPIGLSPSSVIYSSRLSASVQSKRQNPLGRTERRNIWSGHKRIESVNEGEGSARSSSAIGATGGTIGTIGAVTQAIVENASTSANMEQLVTQNEINENASTLTQEDKPL